MLFVVAVIVGVVFFILRIRRKQYVVHLLLYFTLAALADLSLCFGLHKTEQGVTEAKS
jgi:FtsH-binding integral membrane protein